MIEEIFGLMAIVIGIIYLIYRKKNKKVKNTVNKDNEQITDKNKNKKTNKNSEQTTDEKPKITLKMIKEHPELYVEINILNTESNIVESEYIYATESKIKKNGFTYKLDPTGMNLQPTTKGFVPSYFFIMNKSKPYDFTNMNERVPSRIITLLYNLDTYRVLIQPERKNINLILVIIGILTLICLGIYAWINYGHGQIPDLSGLLPGGK